MRPKDRLCRWLLPLLLTLSVSGPSLAEPYIAVAQGYACSACHVNATGGGLRTQFGDLVASSVLPASQLPLVQNVSPWLGQIGDHVRAGADLRADWSLNEVPHAVQRRGFALEQLRAYADLAVIPGRLDLYVDEQLSPGSATAMEAFGRYSSSSGYWYLKAGRFYLPFGWRLQDNTALVRVVSGISMTTPDTGIEIGLERPGWSAQLDFTNGAANTGSGSGEQFTAQVVNIHPRWRLGLAGEVTQSDAGNRRAGGVFAGLRTGPISWLLEEDVVRDEGFAQGPRVLMASLLEANWAIRRGHNLKVTYEYEDPYHAVRNNGLIRGSLVYEYFPFQFAQCRAGIRRYSGIPQNDQQNQTQAFIEVHLLL